MAREFSVKKVLSTTKGKAYTVAGVTIVLLVGMFFLAIRPAFLSVTDQNTQNDVKEKYLAELETKQDTLTGLVTQEGQYISQLDLLNTFLPPKRNDEFISANVSAMADTYNVDLLGLTFQTGKAPDDIEMSQYANLIAVPMRISLNGNLADLQSFLGHIENFPAPITVTVITYTNKDQDAADVVNAEYTLDIDAQYYFWTFGI